MAGPRKFQDTSSAYREYQALGRLPANCPPYTYAATGYPEVQQHELWCREPGPDGQLCGHYNRHDIGNLWNHLQKKHGYQRKARPSFQALTWSQERFHQLDKFYVELMKKAKEGGGPGLRGSGRPQDPSMMPLSMHRSELDEDDPDDGFILKQEPAPKKHEDVETQRQMKMKCSQMAGGRDGQDITRRANGLTGKRKREGAVDLTSEDDEAVLVAQLKEKRAKREMKEAKLEVKEAAFEEAEVERKLAARRMK